MRMETNLLSKEKVAQSNESKLENMREQVSMLQRGNESFVEEMRSVEQKLRKTDMEIKKTDRSLR